MIRINNFRVIAQDLDGMYANLTVVGVERSTDYMSVAGTKRSTQKDNQGALVNTVNMPPHMENLSRIIDEIDRISVYREVTKATVVNGAGGAIAGYGGAYLLSLATGLSVLWPLALAGGVIAAFTGMYQQNKAVDNAQTQGDILKKLTRIASRWRMAGHATAEVREAMQRLRPECNGVGGAAVVLFDRLLMAIDTEDEQRRRLGVLREHAAS